MPGSSLWLLPPPTHPLTPHLTSLIRKTSSHFSSPHLFLPHVTLTSGIEPKVYAGGAQAWLDGLPFLAGGSEGDVVVRLEGVRSEDVFVRKLYVKVRKEGVEAEGLRGLAGVVRREGVMGGKGEAEAEAEAERWVREVYRPHLSLLYHDIPKIDDEGLKVVEEWTHELAKKMEVEGGFWGWRGGKVVLVETEKDISEWVPIAERDV
ncbi:2, 3 cyclic phosphodiesterase [Massarina eburnea CBS 473.64]|uniref:2, 3 cyclic phosphodiesterase n=1 Tax=Massarina eburnea CBS 473.64 TaxID=1395130 RepID=A0A6A6RSG2_9PLEO|nr:2, 3 cyclic phosphodiesterase [Massarina eburnea CBS 473.64]